MSDGFNFDLYKNYWLNLIYFRRYYLVFAAKLNQGKNKLNNRHKQRDYNWYHCRQVVKVFFKIDYENGNQGSDYDLHSKYYDFSGLVKSQHFDLS